MASISLHERTLALVYNRPKPMTYARMASDLANHGITLPWLAQFSSLKNPDVKRTQALYEYLTGKPLLTD